MQAIPGGAAAQPFKTFHNALGCEFYLRIALELYHKRLLVGGIDKLFEIGKNFRNEGLSRRHNPEFTMLEAYCAFGDYATMMETVESLITTVAQKVLGTLEIPRSANAELREKLSRLCASDQSETAFSQSWEIWKKLLNQNDRNKIALNSAIVERIFRETFEDSQETSKNPLPEIDKLQDKIGQEPYVEIIGQAITLIEDIKIRSMRRFIRLQEDLELTAPDISTTQQPFDRIIDGLKELQKPISLTRPWRRVKCKKFNSRKNQRRLV